MTIKELSGRLWLEKQNYELIVEKLRLLLCYFMTYATSLQFCAYRITIEALLEYKAVIVFCSTKAETEQNAILIAKYIKYCTNKGYLVYICIGH